MLKSDSIASFSSVNDSIMKTNSKQIALIRFDDNLNQQQLLPNYISNISDQVKVGFYSCDRCTQTEQSDIIAIGEATHNLIYLCKEIDVVKYDLNFAKNSYHNRFDQELHNKSIEIYGIINQKLIEMKKQHEENVDRIRKAYKTQLANAIVKITNIAESKYSSLLPENSNLDRDDFKTQALMQRIKELQRVISEQEFNMKSAKEKSDEVLERIIPNGSSSASSGRPLTTDSSSSSAFNNHQTNNLNEDNELVVKALTDERDNAFQEIKNVNKKVTRLEDALNLKEEESERLVEEIAQLHRQIDNEKTHTEQVAREFQEFKNKAEIEKQKMKKEFDKQKKDIETKMQEKLKETRDQIVNAAKEELRQQQLESEKQRQQLEEKQKQQEKKQQQQLLEQQKKSEEVLKKNLEMQQKQQDKLLEKAKHDKEKELERLHHKEKEHKQDKQDSQSTQGPAAAEQTSDAQPSPVKISRKDDLELISKLKNTELFQKAEITRLNREIQRNNETWEKRFDILKHSLHAIKDEMYLRQNLQKQSLQLAYASIAYTMDEAPSQQQSHSAKNDTNPMSQIELKITKPVLPSIGKSNERQASSVTVSMPSRLSCQLENDEAQIIDDDEMKKFKEEYLTDVDYIIAK